MKQSNSKNRVIRNVAVCALLTAATCCTSLGVKFLSNVTAENGVTLVCDSDIFTTTANYKYLDYAYANETTLRDAEKTMTGMLIKANKTGTGAEGASFVVQETQTSDFSIDFRVFSQTTYKHDCYRTSTHYNASVAGMQADEYNPFLDLKEVQFTFTSVSDTTQSVSLFVRGSENYKAYGVTAYVGSQTSMYPTAIAGTSFSNFNAKDYSDGQETTNYNSVTFNKTLGVVAVNGTTIQTLDASALAKYADGYTVKVTYSDVTANDSTGNELAAAFNAREVEQGLSPTKLSGIDLTNVQGKEYKYHESANGFADYAGNRYGPNMGYSEGVGEAYDRNAQMLVYSVNGQSVVVEDTAGKTEVKASSLITVQNEKLTAKDNQTNKLDGNNGLLITSEGKASGDDAEGAYFYFNDTMNGEFEMDFRVTSEKTYQSKVEGWGTAMLSDNKYYSSDVANPYADVREVAFTFTSKTDTSKWFTVYISSGDFEAQSYSYGAQARVRVSGDTYATADANQNLVYGYGLSYNNETYNSPYKWTTLWNTSFSNYAVTKGPSQNWAWKHPTPYANSIRFDPVEMKVYAGGALVESDLYTDRTETKDYLVRDLTNNDGVAWGKEVYWKQVWKTLCPEDFAGGYTVSVQFTSITSDETVAKASTAETDIPELLYDHTNGYVAFDTPYDRNINMTIYSLNGTNFGSVGSKITDTESANLSAPTKMSAFVENDITPLYFDVIDGDTIPENGYGKVYVSTDNKASWTEVEKNAENKYLYTPSVAVKEYFVKYEGFADSVGNVTPTKEYAVAGVYSGFNMVGGASVRLASGDAGIRFTARVDKSVYENLATAGLSNVKFFFEVTVTYDKNGVETSKTLAKEVSVDNIYENGEFMQMTASVTDLTNDMYDYKWSAKAYMSFEKGGESGVLYAQSYDNTRTVRDIALSALVDHEDDSYGISYGDTDLAILKSLAGLA
ncbi:MAG: hypothetical protein IKL76_01100 [Clostridia bacterium]|nr:hypothetical protein [Clostridia bacterium]